MIDLVAVAAIATVAAGLGIWIGMLIARRLDRTLAAPDPEDPSDKPPIDASDDR